MLQHEPFRAFDRLTETQANDRRTGQIPVDAYGRGNELKVHLDLPGADPGSIELTIENDVLTVRATRRWVRAEGR